MDFIVAIAAVLAVWFLLAKIWPEDLGSDQFILIMILVVGVIVFFGSLLLMGTVRIPSPSEVGGGGIPWGALAIGAVVLLLVALFRGGGGASFLGVSPGEMLIMAVVLAILILGLMAIFIPSPS